MPPTVDVLVPKLFSLGAPKVTRLNKRYVLFLNLVVYRGLSARVISALVAQVFVLCVLLILWNTDICLHKDTWLGYRPPPTPMKRIFPRLQAQT